MESELSAQGSNRRYFRVDDEDRTFIRTVGTSARENRAFVTLARHFRSKGINVPEIFDVSDDWMTYTQQDLGDTSLFGLVSEGRRSGSYSEEERELLRKTISRLPEIQHKGAEGLDFDVCFPDREFNGRMVDFDLNYFKYCFLKGSGVEFDEIRLQDDFDKLKSDLLEDTWDTFMYRDFQARNVMIYDGEPYFIDFQGGRKGPIYYDVASFIWQARSRFPSDLKTELTDAYISALQEYRKTDRDEFYRRLRLFVLFRTLQVLGAYGFRGFFEKKPHFLQSIPFAIDNLRELLEEPFEGYQYLCEVLGNICTHYQTAERPGNGGLTVEICSFSYRKGIPQTRASNGGGYVFDCRGSHNPGKYEQYRDMTGLDSPVVEFIEKDGELPKFLENVYSIVDAHVARFIERGFTSLEVCFGCTGGHHRSVYSAEHLGMHLIKKFNVEVTIRHRELGIEKKTRTMKAMIFAAGLGTRLKPLTDSIPKALVPIGGTPMLGRLILKLKDAGFGEFVINTHHFSDKIREYLEANDNFGASIMISEEKNLPLETGGGIKNARAFLEGSGPFLAHNVDIVSNLDVSSFVKDFRQGSMATLLVSERQTKRYLLFDEGMRLVGWTNVETGQVRSPYGKISPEKFRKLAFSGIQIISNDVFSLMEGEPEVFSIMDFYLKYADRYPIYGVVKEGVEVVDIGKPETLRDIESNFRWE